MAKITKEQRNAAARKANATRKANKEAEQKEEARQQELRGELWEKLTEKEQEAIAEPLRSPLCVVEDEYEDLISGWHHDKCEEVKDTYRTLLRNGVAAKLILAAIEQGHIVSFDLGVYGETIDPEEILNEVLTEDEFRGMNQPTPEAKQKMWELTETYVSQVAQNRE